MKKETANPIYLDVEFDDLSSLKEDFANVLKNIQFQNLVKTELYELVANAIKQKEQQFVAFRLPYYNIDLVVQKNMYKNLLNTILQIFVEEEDYLKCATISAMIDSI